MANNFEESASVILKRVRLDYNDLYKAVPSQEENKKNDRSADRFKIKAIIDRGSEADKAAQGAMLEAARKMWDDNAVTVIKSLPANNKALRNGDEYLTTDGGARPEYAGRLFISASAKPDKRPQVVGPKRLTGMYKFMDDRTIELKNAFVHISEDGRALVDGQELASHPYKIVVPYRGCWVNLKIKFVSGKSQKLPSGVSLPNQVFARLEAVQFVEDGEAFGSGPSSAEGFGDEEVAESEATSGGAGDLF